MSDAVVSVGLDAPDMELRLAQAIEVFTRWRADIAPEGLEDQDAPAIMVKTVLGPDGALCKTLFFEEPKWAEFFLRIWQDGAFAAA